MHCFISCPFHLFRSPAEQVPGHPAARQLACRVPFSTMLALGRGSRMRRRQRYMENSRSAIARSIRSPRLFPPALQGVSRALPFVALSHLSRIVPGNSISVIVVASSCQNGQARWEETGLHCGGCSCSCNCRMALAVYCTKQTAISP